MYLIQFSFAAGFSTMSEIIKSATYHFNTKNDLIQVRSIIINIRVAH